MGNVGDKLCSCNNRDENQDVNMVLFNNNLRIKMLLEIQE
jgi:hypothetical protein